MNIAEVLAKPGIHFSFEFFPPKTEKSSSVLFQSIKELIPLQPSYVSVTYGAGGSMRDLTHDLLMRVRKETNLTVVAHLTTIGATRNEIRTILEQYADSGIAFLMFLISVSISPFFLSNGINENASVSESIIFSNSGDKCSMSSLL